MLGIKSITNLAESDDFARSFLIAPQDHDPMEYSLVIFAARESLATLVRTTVAAGVAGGKLAGIEVLINGNPRLATDFLHWLQASQDRPGLEHLRVWSIVAPDKANAWNQYFHRIWSGERLVFFLDGYVRVHPDSVRKICESIPSDPSVLGGCGLPTGGRTAIQLAEATIKHGGFLGGFCCIQGWVIAEFRRRNFNIPRELYRTDSLIGAVLSYGLDPSANQWDSKRIHIQPDATWEIPIKRWWRFSDIVDTVARRLRQARGVLENAAIKNHLALRKSSPEALPSTAAELVTEWMKNCPFDANTVIAGHPTVRLVKASFARASDWPEDVLRASLLWGGEFDPLKNLHNSSQSMPSIAIYGAIARPNAHPTGRPTHKRRFVRYVFEIRDQLLWIFASPRAIDYRNYDSPFASNVGDLAVAAITRSLFAKQIEKPSYVDLNWGQLNRISNHRQSLDLIVFAGGGYFLLDRDTALPSRILADASCLAKSNLPCVLFGVGVNFPGKSRFDAENVALSSTDEDTVRRLLARMALISVRDSHSKKFLCRYTEKQIHVIGDPALFLLSRTQEQLPITKQSQPLIGINFSFHGPTSNEILRRNIAAYVQTLKKLARDTNCRFRYFVHNDSEHLIPRLLVVKGIKMEVISGAPRKISEAYCDLNLHIGGMLHSCILAHSAGIPCLGLAYDIKHYGFFSLMGLDQNCLSAIDFSPDELLERAKLLLSDPEPTRAAILARRDELELCTNEFVELCLQLRSADHSSQHVLDN